ncbi:serine/threonine-protein kinase/endoribonuclease IRE1a [Morus notabilis]|uniref:serine/threonine-protein kinase/endoribonuclease IRE1a n=1 Tax=Morus notabilis TaxID=981085 RepID=UPI000CECE77B|nr:serine/threonine-protein kinase/endoribonuclease IRE1a [Morus notabilis]
MSDRLSTLSPTRREESTTSSSEVSSNENQLRIGEKLVIFLSKEIGKSSMGTVVYEGSYEGTPVAVKRILKSHHEMADQEIKNFEASDHHQNVVKYYGVEQDRDFIYLVLELCDCNLSDLIEMPSAASLHQYEYVSKDHHCNTISVTSSDEHSELPNILEDADLWDDNNRPTPLLLKLIRDIVSAIEHLHKLGIVHRDVKPENVLIQKQSSSFHAKLSDMDISRRLRDNKSALSNHFSRCGTTGWKAREWLLFERQTHAMDLFSLGCLIFYCITRGIHPFGDHDERNKNIKEENLKNMFLVQGFPEASHLISLLLQPEYWLRPEASEVLHHLLFWVAKKRLFFISDFIDRVSEDSILSKELETAASAILGTERIIMINVVLKWNKKVDTEIIRHISLSAKRDYKFNSVRDLLQLIQYILKHYEQLPKDIQILVGPLYEGLDDYFTRKFPTLLMTMYVVVCTHCKEGLFSEYFESNLLLAN